MKIKTPAALAVLSLISPWGLAQTAPPANAPVQDMGRVEIKSNRDNTMEERRQSTAAKIVIGREELDKQGDGTLGEVLKRLPGVTIQGAPGRGGAIRMRGLGGGYTQILLDGQRVPPGFSVESLTPEMVEKVEIMRAPTAETGARAIAGTINIILREGQRANPDDLKFGGAFENGHRSEGLNWVKNLKTEPLIGTLTVSAMNSWRPEDVTTLTDASVDAEGRMPALSSQRERHNVSLGHRQGMNANARLMWRGEQGKALILMPFMVYSEFSSAGYIDLTENKSINGIQQPIAVDAANTTNNSRFVMTRLNGQWNQRFSADDRFEFKFGLTYLPWDRRACLTPWKSRKATKICRNLGMANSRTLLPTVTSMSVVLNWRACAERKSLLPRFLMMLATCAHARNAGPFTHKTNGPSTPTGVRMPAFVMKVF
jgi:iron complex outermembrane receptor protein